MTTRVPMLIHAPVRHLLRRICASAWLWGGCVMVVWTGCSGSADPTPDPPPAQEAPTPASQASAPEPAASPPDPQPETAAERTARLNREADIRAGLDPDKPLPTWDLSAMKERPPEPPKACEVGAFGELILERGGERVGGGAIEDLQGGPAGHTIPQGRHKKDPALSVARLMGDGATPVTAVNCRGQTAEIPADQLTPDTRWLLVPNRRGELKLIDAGDSVGKVAPTLRHVTLLRR